MYKNFYYSFPTIVYFGDNSVSHLSNDSAFNLATNVLVLCDKTFVYNLNVIDQLQTLNKNYVIIDDCSSNPTTDYISDVLSRVKDIDFVIAIGGGSVIDTAKCIALQYNNDVELVEALNQNKFSNNILPIGVVLTNPASGSEANSSFVIVDSTTNLKVARASANVRPKFAILDYNYIMTLPKHLMFCSIADIFAHLLEQYLSKESEFMFADDLIFGAMKNLIRQTEILKQDYNNNLAKENIMLNATFTLSYLLSMGKTLDWNAHEIEHAISGYYKSLHGSGLSLIFPEYLKYDKVKGCFADKLLYLGENVFNVSTIEKTISCIKNFYEGLELTNSLSDLTNNQFDLEFVVKQVMNNRDTIGRVCMLNAEDVKEILEDVIK